MIEICTQPLSAGSSAPVPAPSWASPILCLEVAPDVVAESFAIVVECCDQTDFTAPTTVLAAQSAALADGHWRLEMPPTDGYVRLRLTAQTPIQRAWIE